MEDQALEFDFFKMLLLYKIANLPRISIGKILDRDPYHMYQVAKGNMPDASGNLRIPLQFHQFSEFITNEIVTC